MREGGLDGLPHLQYINFLSLSDKESVIVSEPCYHCPYFEEEGGDQNSVSSHNSFLVPRGSLD